VNLQMTTIKIVFENEIRRFKVDQSSLSQPFSQISKIIRESYNLEEYDLKYLDDEQDYCVVTSEEEMKEALRFVSKDKVLKLFVQRKAKEENPSIESTVVPNVVSEVSESKPEAEGKVEAVPVVTEVEPKSSEIKLPSGTVHEGIVCDGCEVQPIQGLRFVCTSCKWDLCSTCEAKCEHPQDHILLKVKVPLPPDYNFVSPFPRWVQSLPQRDPSTSRPKAHFVRDVTVSDGSMWRPGQRVLKTWALKNVGNVYWPRGTKLVFVNGTVKPTEDEEQPLVPLAAPGETVDVSVKVQIPDKPGRYTGYYRLSYGADGIKFGHRIWLDVHVSETALPEVANFGREVKNVFDKAFNVISKALKGEKTVSVTSELKNSSSSSSN